MAKPDCIPESDLSAHLETVPAWELVGDAIQRTYVLQGFLHAVAFVNAVAELAEEANHHPDIDIRWDKVTLLLTSHDAGGLTDRDFALATKVEAVFVEME